MEDTKIIDLFFARNEDAIAETDAAYGRKLFALSHRILNNQEDAEESVSDTYMKVWDIVPPQRPKFFYAFLASICRHLSLHKVDWRMAAKRNAEIISLTQEMEMCIPDTTQDRILEGKELGRVMNTFLESLPKDSRLIFLRRYWFGDSVKEIAALYAMTPGAISVRLSRLRDGLRDYLTKEGFFHEA